MPGDSSWLSVVNLECRLGTDLGPLDIDKVHVVGCGVDHSKNASQYRWAVQLSTDECLRPESQRVCDLSVEPDVLVGREEPHHLGADNTDDVAQHGNEDHETVVAKDETWFHHQEMRQADELKDRPAPRLVQTENRSPFRAARR